MTTLDSAEFDRLLAEARDAVAAARTAGPDAADAPDVAASGTDAAAQVYAEVGIGGRLTSLRIDPEVLALGVDPVCARVIEAVNMAQDALRVKLRQQAAAGVDLAVLDQQIQDVQQGAVRQLSTLLHTMTDALQGTARRVAADDD